MHTVGGKRPSSRQAPVELAIDGQAPPAPGQSRTLSSPVGWCSPIRRRIHAGRRAFGSAERRENWRAVPARAAWPRTATRASGSAGASAAPCCARKLFSGPMTADAARVGRVFQAPRPSRPQNPRRRVRGPAARPAPGTRKSATPGSGFRVPAAACKLARERQHGAGGRKGRHPLAVRSVFSAGAPGPLRSAPVRLFCTHARAPHPRPSPRLPLGHSVWIGRVSSKRRHRAGRRRPRAPPLRPVPRPHDGCLRSPE